MCGKTTWAGCGQHVQDVRRTVPGSAWCGGTHTQAQIETATQKRGDSSPACSADGIPVADRCDC